MTIVASERRHLFGMIVDGKIRLSEFGRIVKEEWLASAALRRGIELRKDEFVVMPNHIHGIIWIPEGGEDVDRRGAAALRPRAVQRTAPTPEGPIAGSLGAVIRAFKSATTRRINLLRKTPGFPVWQRNYYEHVIRDNADYLSKQDYILKNPTNWEADEER